MLERLRRAAVFTPDQMTQWEDFKINWDREMADAHGDNGAVVFAEFVQHVLTDLREGRTNSMSVLMRIETNRLVAETPALLVPGARRL